MSHLIEEYAKNLGVKISKPMVAKHFWPLNTEKFITFCLEDRAPSKSYKYYDLAIKMIQPYLQKNNIKIIQIGSANSPRLGCADEYLFDLNFKNFAYILSKSSLHVGVDNVFSHYASSIGTPLVTLFGNVYSQVSKGFWGKSQINIEAPWKVKPCLNFSDESDSINKILPETIANAMLKLLGVNVNVPIKTKFIGDFFTNRIVELVPNFFQPIEELRKELVFIRMDYGIDNQSFINWCVFLNAYSIFSKELIPLNFFPQFKSKIKSVSFIINKDFIIPEDYLKSLEQLQVPIVLLVENEEDLSILRERYFDYSVQLYFKSNKNSLPESCSDFSKLFCSSSKVLFANGQQYASKYHWLKGEKMIDNSFILCDNETLLEELQHFYLYERTT